MNVNTRCNSLAMAFCAATLTSVCTTPTQALEYEVGEWLFNVDTTLGLAAQWRTESRDKDLAADINSNDGNYNFDPGLVSARGNIIVDFGGEYRDFSFFLRADAVYDEVYSGNDTDMSELGYQSQRHSGGRYSETW